MVSVFPVFFLLYGMGLTSLPWQANKLGGLYCSPLHGGLGGVSGTTKRTQGFAGLE